MPAFDDLASRHCTPLRGPEHRLSADAVAARLSALPGWKLVEDGAAISRSFDFDDYHRTMAFVNALAFVAHREDHHPDLGVHYKRCVVRFNTHSAQGLTETDFECAALVDALVA